MNKDLELDIIEYQLKQTRSNKIKLQRMLSKKGRSDEHTKILSDTLEQEKAGEQQLLNQRDKIQATNSV